MPPLVFGDGRNLLEESLRPRNASKFEAGVESIPELKERTGRKHLDLVFVGDDGFGAKGWYCFDISSKAAESLPAVVIPNDISPPMPGRWIVQPFAENAHSHDNKAELDKIVSGNHGTKTNNPHQVSAEQVGAVPATQKGRPAGIASLDEEGCVPTEQIPVSIARANQLHVHGNRDELNKISDGEHQNRTTNPHKVTAEQTKAIPASKRGVPDGVAALDENGRVPVGQVSLSIARVEQLHNHTNKAELDKITDGEHDSRVTNPHKVTAKQAGAVALSEKGVPDGVPFLDENGLVPDEQIPSSIARGIQLHAHANKAELDKITDGEHQRRENNPHKVTTGQIGAVSSSEKGLPNGVASLDGDGRVPNEQIPPSIVRDEQLHGHANKVELDKITDGGHAVKTNNPHKVTPGQIGSVSSSEKGAPNGVASLDEGGQVFDEQVPSSIARASQLHDHTNKAELDKISDGGHDSREDNPHKITLSQIGGVRKQLAVFYPNDVRFPVKNPVGLDVRNERTVLSFDDTTPEFAIFEGVMPGDYASGDLKFSLWYAMNGANGGDTFWDFFFERVDTDGFNLDSNAFPLPPVGVGDLVPSVSGLVHKVTKTVTRAQAGGIQPGEPFRIKIAREPSKESSSAPSDAHVVCVEISQ